MGRKPHELALSPDGSVAYVTNYGVDGFSDVGPGEKTITLVDMVRREKLGEIDLGDSRRPHGIEVGASGRLYVTADQPPRLLVIDPATDEITGRLEIPGHPARLRVVPSSPYLLVSLIEAGDVAVVDTRSLQVVHRTHFCGRAEAVTADPAGRFGYISCQGESMVVRFSIPEAKPVIEIHTGGKPDPLIVLPAK